MADDKSTESSSFVDNESQVSSPDSDSDGLAAQLQADAAVDPSAKVVTFA